MDTELALQEAVAKYAMPTRAAEKAIRTAQKGGPQLVLRAKKAVKPVKYGLVRKRMVLGRDLSTDGHDTRMRALDAEEQSYEAASKTERMTHPWTAHQASDKDQTRWLKEMDAHADDPVRRSQMQYAAQRGLDYPLKAKRKAKPRKRALVAKAWSRKKKREAALNVGATTTAATIPAAVIAGSEHQAARRHLKAADEAFRWQNLAEDARVNHPDFGVESRYQRRPEDLGSFKQNANMERINGAQEVRYALKAKGKRNLALASGAALLGTTVAAQQYARHNAPRKRVSKKLPSALKLGMTPTSAYGKARLEANRAGRVLVPKGLRMQREGKAMQREASDLVRRQQRNAYGHLTERQRDQVFHSMGEQQFRAQEPGLFLEVNGEQLASGGLKAGRAAKARGRRLL